MSTLPASPDLIVKRKPLEIDIGLKKLISLRIVEILDWISIIFLSSSSIIVVLNYLILLFGSTFNEHQKMVMDYSIAMLAGSAVYQLTYAKKINRIIDKVLRISHPKFIKL